MSEIGEIIVDLDNNNNMQNSDALAEEPLSYIQKKSESVVVTSLAKVLFKISLLVLVLYLPWAVLSFIELVALRML